MQALLDHVERDEQRGGDLLVGHAFLAHGLECTELVEEM
ncbi:hypothetical protein V1291_002433 [Nitrobacteraceae bacterium AZCC 1564]